MDEIVPSSGKQRRVPLHQDGEFFSAIQRGRELAADLDKAMFQLHHRYPHAVLVLEDQTGVPVRTVGNMDNSVSYDIAWNRMPLMFNNHQFGCLRFMGDVGKLSNTDMMPILLSLIEIEHWAQTECERRGEKIQKLLLEGVTPNMTRLLSLCGLVESSGYILVAMELNSSSDKFLYMDQLRRFMMARLWRFQEQLDFIAFRPGGLLGIFPIEQDDKAAWEREVEKWLDEWHKYQASLSRSKIMEVRACVSSVESLQQLDHGIRKIESLLQLADTWNLSGLIRPRFSHTLMTDMLSNLTESKTSEIVQGTIGPLLTEENEELLHTLRVYLLSDQHVTHAAKMLYIHRNTLLYRIKHIEEMLDLNLHNTAQLSAVWFAIEGLELLGSSGFGESAGEDRRNL